MTIQAYTAGDGKLYGSAGMCVTGSIHTTELVCKFEIVETSFPLYITTSIFYFV